MNNSAGFYILGLIIFVSILGMSCILIDIIIPRYKNISSHKIKPGPVNKKPDHDYDEDDVIIID